MLTPLRLTPEQIESKLDRILLKVQKPGRYVGGELNSIVKDWDKVTTRVAFVFPDIYDIGVSNVGLKILYDQVNQREDALAERAYAPWLDMEALMREHEIPLYTLESKRPLACFDLIGFSLPYETLYTNALNVLDLAGIPVRSADRDETHPLIIAGGHSTMNPEPMHAFIDAFVIGEGEEVIHDIIDAMQDSKERGKRKEATSSSFLFRCAHELLHELAQIQGVYVPRFYEAYYLEDGTLSHIEPTVPDVPRIVTKRIVPVLPPPPTKFIVPNIDIVHIRPDGVGTIVFASKTTASWEAILKAVVDAGWIITGSWPIDTEREARVSAQGQARLASSIHLVCRPRENPDGSLRTDDIGDWREVLRSCRSASTSGCPGPSPKAWSVRMRSSRAWDPHSRFSLATHALRSPAAIRSR